MSVAVAVEEVVVMKTAYETSVRQFDGVYTKIEWRIGYTSYYA
jgi:hypothetical protein